MKELILLVTLPPYYNPQFWIFEFMGVFFLRNKPHEYLLHFSLLRNYCNWLLSCFPLKAWRIWCSDMRKVDKQLESRPKWKWKVYSFFFVTNCKLWRKIQRNMENNVLLFSVCFLVLHKSTTLTKKKLFHT